MELFQYIDDVALYAQGVERSILLSDLNVSYLQAEKAVKLCIGEQVYERITNKEDPAEECVRMLEQIKYAVANYMMYKYLMFWAVSKNNTDQKLYKYQYEAIKEEYINVFWTAMDTLLALLDSSDMPQWKESEYYRTREQLMIKSAAEFDRYLQIDRSAYFYSKIIFLIKKVTEDNIAPRISQISQPLLERLQEKIKRALCYNVMAEAVQLFDLTELPKSFRNDIAHEFSKEGSMIQVREKLAQYLMGEAEKYFSAIEGAVSNQVSSSEGGPSPVTNDNDQKDKYYFIC